VSSPVDGNEHGDDDLVAVGRVGPARGVRGEVFVEPWTDAPDERFAPGITLRTATGTLSVADSTSSSGKLVVHFDGIDDRVSAEAIRGTELFVAAAERPVLDDPDDFYDTDLIGLDARNASGVSFGPVVDVVHAAGADYLVLNVQGHERLVPFVSAIVPSVDIAGGTITIDPPEGLFDL